MIMSMFHMALVIGPCPSKWKDSIVSYFLRWKNQMSLVFLKFASYLLIDIYTFYFFWNPKINIALIKKC